MTFAVAGQIMMSGKAVIRPLTVTTNGIYTAPSSIDGYSPVSVSVPDRYDEGHQEGYNEGHQEGYDEGYTDGDKAGRTAQKEICDKEKVILIDRITELEEKQGYTFPEGTDYDSIHSFVGADTVIDKTIGYGVGTITVASPSDPTREDVWVIVVDSTGKEITKIHGTNAPVEIDWRVDSIYVHSTGYVDTTWSYKDGDTRKTVEYTYYSVYLDGFGSSGHEITVRNGA